MMSFKVPCFRCGGQRGRDAVKVLVLRGREMMTFVMLLVRSDEMSQTTFRLRALKAF